MTSKKPLGWGTKTEDGEEMWDDLPVFRAERVRGIDLLKLFFYPKKAYLYGWVDRYVKKYGAHRKIKIIDVGCGTGGAVIDIKKRYGRKVEIVGIDVLDHQVELAKARMKEFGVWAEFYTYDGYHLPFSDESIDIILSSDVLGHVGDVPLWLQELSRVLKKRGELLLFSESAIGKHALIRQYLAKKGINTDPHKEEHISLYGKQELKELLFAHGFVVKTMISVFLAKFFVHPDELYPVLSKASGVPVLRFINRVLTFVKKITRPISLAVCEGYGHIEMMLIGRFVESQGYLIRSVKELVRIEEKQEVTTVQKFTSMTVEVPAMRVQADES